MAKVDRNRLDHILGIDYLRKEFFGLHFVQERIQSTDHKITANGDQVSTSIKSNGQIAVILVLKINYSILFYIHSIFSGHIRRQQRWLIIGYGSTTLAMHWPMT